MRSPFDCQSAAAGSAGVRSQSCGYSVPTPPWQYSCSPGDRRAAAGGPAMSMKGSAPRRSARSYGQLGPGPACWPPWFARSLARWWLVSLRSGRGPRRCPGMQRAAATPGAPRQTFTFPWPSFAGQPSAQPFKRAGWRGMWFMGNHPGPPPDTHTHTHTQTHRHTHTQTRAHSQTLTHTAPQRPTEPLPPFPQAGRLVVPAS